MSHESTDRTARRPSTSRRQPTAGTPTPPVHSTATDTLGAGFVTQAALVGGSPLGDWYMGLSELDTAAADLGAGVYGNAAVQAAAVDLQNAPSTAMRDAADSSRYVLPEEALDGRAMVSRSGTGRPLAPDHRARFEALLGQDLSSVRIYESSSANAAAAAVDAHAFTVGENVVFASGQYAPGTAQGDQLLAHELTHVLQFRRSDPRTRSSDPYDVKGVEDEADRMGAMASSQLPAVEAVNADGLDADVFHAETVSQGPELSPQSTVNETAQNEQSVATEAAAGEAVAARDGTGSSASELSLLIHRYRRFIRRITSATEEEAEFRSQASEANQQDESSNLPALIAQRTQDIEARDAILARIRSLKGDAYADAVVARYGGERDDEGWFIERSGSVEGSRGGGRGREYSNTADEEEEAPAAATPEVEGQETDADADAPATPPSPQGGQGSSDTEGVQDGDEVTVGSGSGIPVPERPPAQPVPGDHVDDGSVAPEQPQTEAPAVQEEDSNALEGGVPEAGLNPDGDETTYVLYEGQYADVTLDVAFMDFQGEMTGNLAESPDIGEWMEALRNADSLGDVVRTLSQVDPTHFQMDGSVRAALDAIRGTLTVHGAPWPVSLGGQEFLADWTILLTARAYAELYASGEVTSNLGNLTLEGVGGFGARILAEASASATVGVDWMGDAFPTLAEVVVEGSASAGAQLEGHVTLRMGPGVVEIGAGFSATWGLGAGLNGKLRVAVLPTLELIAAYLGVDTSSLPEPLQQVWDTFRGTRSLWENLLDAGTWLSEMKPLELLAGLLTSEEFWNLFDTLVEEGVASVAIVQWLSENYASLGETAPEVTILGETYNSYILWYALSFGLEFAQWVEDTSIEVLLRVLPLMAEFRSAVLRVVVAAGPWVIGLIEQATDFVLWAAGRLGDEFGPLLAPVGAMLVRTWTELGRPACEWIVERLAEGASYLVALYNQYGPAFLTWAQGVPARVQAWFEEMTPAALDALYQGGQYLLDLVVEYGQSVLAYLDEWAPGVVALFTNMSQDLYAAMVQYGQEFFAFCVRIGQNALAFVGPYAERAWTFIQEGAQATIDWLVSAAAQHINPLLDLLDARGGQLVQEVVAWLGDQNALFNTWLATNLPAFMSTVDRLGDAIWPHLEAFGTHMQDVWMWVVELSGPVADWLVQNGSPVFEWVAEQLAEEGAEFLRQLEALGDALIELWAWGKPQLATALAAMAEVGEWILDEILEHGPGAIDWLQEVGEESWALFMENNRLAFGHLVTAGQWTVELLTAIGAPLLPILSEWGGALAGFGETIAQDLIAAYNDYGEPVVSFMLRLGNEAWTAYGLTISEIAPLVDRFAREGIENARLFLVDFITEVGRPGVTFLLERTEAGLTELYTFATTEGVVLVRRMADNFEDLVAAVADQGEAALQQFLALGEWAIQVGESGVRPSVEVLEHYGEEYGVWFDRYGDPMVQFFVALGERAAALITQYGEALAALIVRAGTALYQFGLEVLDWLLPKVIAVGDWLWDRAVEGGQIVLDVLQWATTELIAAWTAYGAPALDFCIRVGRRAIELHQQFNELLFETVVAVGTAIYEWGEEWLPIILGKLQAAGDWLLEHIVAIGRPIVEFLVGVGETVWAELSLLWQRYGDQVVQFCVSVGEVIGQVIGVIADAVWAKIQEDARRAYALYTEYGLPVLQALGDGLIWFGEQIWDATVAHGRQLLDNTISLGRAAGAAMIAGGEAIWAHILEDVEDLRRLWADFGAPVVAWLAERGREIIDLYNEHGAPIVREIARRVEQLGSALWDAAVTLGNDLLDLARDIGEPIWAWLAQTAADAWNNLKEAGAQFWALCQRVGRGALDLIQEYGPRAVTWGKALVEDTVATLGQLAAQRLAVVLQGGLDFLNFVGEAGVALIGFLEEAPNLPTLLAEHGQEAADLILANGVALLRVLKDAPGNVWNACVDHGQTFVNLLITGGTQLVQLIRDYGTVVIDYTLRYGERFVNLVLEYGSVVITALMNVGGRALDLIESGMDWML